MGYYLTVINRNCDFWLVFSLIYLIYVLYIFRGSPSVPHISSTQKGHSCSALKISQFNTKNPSVPNQKPLRSTHPSVQTKNWGLCLTQGFVELEVFWCGTGVSVLNWGGLVLNWGVCWTEGILVWNSGILVLNWGVFGIELMDFVCWKSVVLVLKWCLELRGYVWN